MLKRACMSDWSHCGSIALFIYNPFLDDLFTPRVLTRSMINITVTKDAFKLGWPDDLYFQSHSCISAESKLRKTSIEQIVAAFYTTLHLPQLDVLTYIY